MLNETNSELEERLDSAAIEEMMIRTGVQMPASIYQEVYGDHMNHRQAIEAKEWNDRHGY